MVEPDGHRLGGDENKGRGRVDRQYQQIGIEHRRGGRTKGGRKMRASRAGPAGRSGVEQVQASGSESRRIDIKFYMPLRWWNQTGID